MSVPVCTINENGIFKPDYSTVLFYFQDKFKSIYGQDIYIEPDSQDGQMIAIFAQAVDDVNSQCIATYNSFSPSTARGIGLASNVKINGLKKLVPSFSTVDLLITGQVGTIVNNGIAQSTGGIQWLLPSVVAIPLSGSITVTATAKDAGSVLALPGEVSTIGTPTRGWQQVTNIASAVSGSPFESDAALRRRQTVSTALPSRTVFEGTIGAVAAVLGVLRYSGYENDTNITDSNGIPSHSISIVVQGGDAQAIAQAIADKKTPGTGTHGTTTALVTDEYGVARTIRFYRPTFVTIKVEVSLVSLQGYTTDIEASVKLAIVEFINNLSIGSDVEWGEVFVPANLTLASGSKTYKITQIRIAKNVGALGMTDIDIAFNEAANSTLTDITVILV